jgi:hypothetical protein
MEEIKLKLFKVAIRHGDLQSSLRYLQELSQTSLDKIQYILLKLACQTGIITIYQSYFLSLVPDKHTECIALLCKAIESKNEHLFFPQMIGYYVGLICSTDWVNEDNNTFLNDCTLRQLILKKFENYPIIVQGRALNIVSFLLSNVQNDGDLQFVIHYYRNCRNFLKTCDIVSFWQLLSLVFEYDQSLVELKPWVSMMQKITITKHKFSSITRSAIICIGMVLINKMQDQVCPLISTNAIHGKNVRYAIIHEELISKYPYYGAYMDRKINSLAFSLIFNINAIYNTIRRAHENQLNIAQYIDQIEETLPDIKLDKVSPYLNRFFLDAPWAGEIDTTDVIYLYSVKNPRPMLIAGPYTLAQTKILNRWKLFFEVLESSSFFNVDINLIMNSLFYASIPAVSISSVASSSDIIYITIYLIGCYIVEHACPYVPQDVIIAPEDGNPRFIGALQCSINNFSIFSWCDKWEKHCNSSAAKLEILENVKFYFEKNKKLLDLPYNIAHLKSNTWINKIDELIQQQSETFT